MWMIPTLKTSSQPSSACALLSGLFSAAPGSWVCVSPGTFCSPVLPGTDREKID